MFRLSWITSLLSVGFVCPDGEVLADACQLEVCPWGCLQGGIRNVGTCFFFDPLKGGQKYHQGPSQIGSVFELAGGLLTLRAVVCLTCVFVITQEVDPGDSPDPHTSRS